LATRQSLSRPDDRRQIAGTVALRAWHPPGWLNEPDADPSCAVVMAAFRALADSGKVVWTLLESGEVRLSCDSGEVYRLTERGVTRLR
jgi:hypothetical protein